MTRYFKRNFHLQDTESRSMEILYSDSHKKNTITWKRRGWSMPGRLKNWCKRVDKSGKEKEEGDILYDKEKLKVKRDSSRNLWFFWMENVYLLFILFVFQCLQITYSNPILKSNSSCFICTHCIFAVCLRYWI